MLNLTHNRKPSNRKLIFFSHNVMQESRRISIRNLYELRKKYRKNETKTCHFLIYTR
jgi:hypothetical protein